MYLKARAGVFTESNIRTSVDTNLQESWNVNDLLVGKSIHEIKDFSDLVRNVDGVRSKSEVSRIAQWLNTMFGNTP